MYVTLPTEYGEVSAVKTSGKSCSQSRFTKPAIACRAGRTLFREGDQARQIYEVKNGVLRLSRVMENGRRQVISFGYPGDIIGFPADGLHHTDCDLITRAELIAYPIEALESGSTDPFLHRRLVAAALREIGGMQDHFMMLGRKSAKEKMASFLKVLAERTGQPVGHCVQVDLAMTRSDIADFLGLTTETVSRVFTQLRRQNVIALENAHRVLILNPDALCEIAEGE